MKKEVKVRHKITFSLARFLMKPYLKHKYHFKYERYHHLLDKPALILSNHSTAFDPFLLSLSFDRQIYFVATEQVFNLGFLSRIIVYLVNIISKRKSVSDFQTIKKIKKIVKEGGSVGIFPEGNITINGCFCKMAISIGKLIKALNIPVIIYKIEGVSLVDPRWSIEEKKGNTRGYISKVISPEEYQDLSYQEVYNQIYNELSISAYTNDFVIKQEYCGKNKAEGLERLMFFCPSCHSFLTLSSKGNHITCGKCQQDFIYDDHGYVVSDSFGKMSLLDLDMIMRNLLKNYLRQKHSKPLFSNDGMLQICYKKTRKKLGKVQVIVRESGLELRNKGTIMFYKYANIISVAMQGKNKIIVYFEDREPYLIIFDNKTSTYLYLLTYQFYRFKFENNEDLYTGNVINSSDMGI